MSRYIDADELLKRLSREDADEGAAFVNFVRKVVELRIESMPTADVAEVRHGRWMSSNPSAPMFGFDYCSICGRKRTSPQDNYCPNCGALMVNEDEEMSKVSEMEVAYAEYLND